MRSALAWLCIFASFAISCAGAIDRNDTADIIVCSVMMALTVFIVIGDYRMHLRDKKRREFNAAHALEVERRRRDV